MRQGNTQTHPYLKKKQILNPPLTHIFNFQIRPIMVEWGGIGTQKKWPHCHP